MFTEIRCNNCFKLIPSDEIDISKELAHCSHCNKTMSIATKVKVDVRNKNNIDQPEYCEIDQRGKDALHIRMGYNFSIKQEKHFFKAMKVIYIISLLMMLVPVLGISFGIAMIFGFEGISPSPLGIWALFAGSILFYIWKYYSFDHFLSNMSYFIDIKNGQMSIRNPRHKMLTKILPQVKKEANPYTIKTTEIQQLFVKMKKKQQGKHLYELAIRKVDGDILTPFASFIQMSDALFLEQEIEQFLTIKDDLQDQEVAV